MEMFYWRCDLGCGQHGIVIADDDLEALRFVRAQMELDPKHDALISIVWLGGTDRGCYILPDDWGVVY